MQAKRGNGAAGPRKELTMYDKDHKEESAPIKDETLDEVTGGYIIIGPSPNPLPPGPPPTRPGRMRPM